MRLAEWIRTKSENSIDRKSIEKPKKKTSSICQFYCYWKTVAGNHSQHWEMSFLELFRDSEHFLCKLNTQWKRSGTTVFGILIIQNQVDHNNVSSTIQALSPLPGFCCGSPNRGSHNFAKSLWATAHDADSPSNRRFSKTSVHDSKKSRHQEQRHWEWQFLETTIQPPKYWGLSRLSLKIRLNAFKR